MKTKKSAVELSDLVAAEINKASPEAKATMAHVVPVPNAGDAPNWKVTGYGQLLPPYVVKEAGSIVAALQALYDLDE